MSRDKQIEEIAKVIKSSLDGLGSGNFNFTGDEISTMFAEALYNAGYRKASDVANEIIDIINDFFPKVRELTKGGVVVNLLPTMQEALVKKLKKKYESEGEG